MSFIVFAIPVFFLLIGIEFLIDRLKQSNLYRFNDAVTNISCGISQQVTAVALKTLLLGGYWLLYEQYGIFDIPNTIWTYALLFVGVDFFYYWFHRYAHEVSAFWGTHIVHHQSEEYNLSVALRQSIFQTVISNVFYLPLALIGFHPLSFVLINSLQTLYQFWIHTKTIGKMHPILEFVFNTPSHHRVHHGINPKYIDKNHGGTFIIFDRMFGTFQAEEEEVVYGVTRPLSSWNPLWANIDYYAELYRSMRPAKFPDKLRMLKNKPGWRPDYLGGPLYPQPITREEQLKYDTDVSMSLNYYILFQYLILLGLATAFLLVAKSLPVALTAVGIASILWSVANIGGILEGRVWASILEPIRWLAIPVLLYIFLGATVWWGSAVVASIVVGLFSVGWFISALNLERAQTR